MDNVLTINVAVTTDAAATELELAKVTPSDVRLEVFSVARTEDALDGKHEDIAASSEFFRSIGTAFHSVYTDVRSNSVVIAVSTLDPMTKQLITDRFGPGVQVIVGEPAEPDACSRTNCGPPWKGGVKVYRTANGNQCTSNFVARYYAGSWFYNLWTSGHCLSGTWKQGTSSGTTIGSTVNNYFVNGTRADVQTISMSSSYRDNRYINSTSVSCTNCTLGTIIYKQGHDTDLVGEVVCNNGAFSGKKCGDVISTNFTFVWTEENKTLYRQRLASYSRMSGDSGGPVVSATNTAAGSHTHHQVLAGFDRAIYSHVWEMEQATGQTVYLGGS